MSRESRHDTLLKIRQTHAAGVDAVDLAAVSAMTNEAPCGARSHPDDAGRVVDRRRAVLACGTPVDLEVRMRRLFLFAPTRCAMNPAELSNQAALDDYCLTLEAWRHAADIESSNCPPNIRE